jgi:hypothetical protein
MRIRSREHGCVSCVSPPCLRAAAEVGTVSTTNSGLVAAASGGTAVNVYETPTAVSEYLMFHFAPASLLMPYPAGPHNALDFAKRYVLNPRPCLCRGACTCCVRPHLHREAVSTAGIMLRHKCVEGESCS